MGWEERVDAYFLASFGIWLALGCFTVRPGGNLVSTEFKGVFEGSGAEVWKENELTAHVKPKGSNAWVNQCVPTRRGSELLSLLGPYEDLASSGQSSYKPEERYLKAIALILLDRLPLARTDGQTAKPDAEGSAKP
jgi:hypothetical protein